MSARIQINVSTGLLEVEGTEEFVLQIYEEAKKAGLLNFNGQRQPSADKASQPESAKSRVRRAPSKRGGPSCAERILELRNAGFFDTPKSANEVKAGLEQNGHAYASNQVGAALTNLYQRSELRRLKPGKDWVYQKP